MVGSLLSKEMIDAASALLRELDAQQLEVTAAFWFYLENSDTWTLVISSPSVQREGPKKLYAHIQSLLRTKPDLRLRNVSVLPSDDPTITLLRMAIKTDANSVAGIRFSRNTINGHLIEDAYIYRLT